VTHRSFTVSEILLIAVTAVAAGCGSAPENKQVQAHYDETGKLRQLTYDSNKNGRPDSFSYMNGTKVLRVEIDKDEDGKIDRWEYYGDDQKLEKVGLSRLNSGKVDEWAYQGSDGTVARIETSTKHDGKVGRTEFYEKGTLVRAEEDTDGNGTADKWETYSNGVVASVAFDSEGTGRPTRRLVYGKDGTLSRIETGAALEHPPSQP
jgi:antitoxin component YwqK of YwqJK toxin-antitoxin module